MSHNRWVVTENKLSTNLNNLFEEMQNFYTNNASIRVYNESTFWVILAVQKLTPQYIH